VLEAGIVAGAVYNPADVIVPAVALKLVAFVAVNCCVAPNFTVAVVGEIVGVGGGPAAAHVTANIGPHSDPGFCT
jgi:hypothetical protein